MRHRLIPAALATGASLVLLAGTAMAATPTWTVVPSVNPSATTLNAVSARTATDAWAVGQFQGAPCRPSEASRYPLRGPCTGTAPPGP